jgi:hypothetical protein
MVCSTIVTNFALGEDVRTYHTSLSNIFVVAFFTVIMEVNYVMLFTVWHKSRRWNSNPQLPNFKFGASAYWATAGIKFGRQARTDRGLCAQLSPIPVGEKGHNAPTEN